MNNPSGFIPAPAAIITGQAAYLISRWLRTPSAIASMRNAKWLPGPDVAHALNAIHQAGREWQTGLELRQRDTASRCELPNPNCVTMRVEEAAEYLNLSIRRVQELAQQESISGRHVGRRWELDPISVRAYRERHHQQKRSA